MFVCKNTNSADVLVGQPTGAAAARGFIFEDRGEPDGVFAEQGEAADAVFAGFKVQAVFASEPDADPVLEVESGSMTPVDGRTRSRVQSFLEVVS